MELTLKDLERYTDRYGNIDLHNTDITELPKNLHVKGWLYLSNCSSLTYLPSGLVVHGGLYLNNCTSLTHLPTGLVVYGGGLDLNNCSSLTHLPSGLVVKSSLNLNNCSSLTHLPSGLLVGWNLYLFGTQITELPPNLKVGLKILADDGIDTSKIQRLQQGEYVPRKYIYADEILTPIKSCHKVGQYTYYVGKFKDDNVLTDGKYYAHCENIRQGIRDIEFKKVKDRGMEQYRDLDIDMLYPTDYIINMYRVITGACEQGTQHFVDSLGELEDSYTIREAINITQGQYNSNVFRDFFI